MTIDLRDVGIVLFFLYGFFAWDGTAFLGCLCLLGWISNDDSPAEPDDDDDNKDETHG